MSRTVYRKPDLLTCLALLIVFSMPGLSAASQAYDSDTVQTTDNSPALRDAPATPCCWDTERIASGGKLRMMFTVSLLPCMFVAADEQDRLLSLPAAAIPLPALSLQALGTKLQT